MSFQPFTQSPTTRQQYSFESMENLSEHRDRANKMVVITTASNGYSTKAKPFAGFRLL
jgi:hypothetical protein